MPRPRSRRRLTNLELLETRRMPAVITVAAVQAVEANSATTATFTATLNEASTTPVTLTYSTVNGTARAGRDYTATKSTVTIPAGSTSATFSVPILASDVAGKANEKFYVDLNTSTGNTVKVKQVAATIVDGNAKPTVTASDLTFIEPTSGSKTGDVTVSLSNPSAKAVRVSYATIDGTAVSTGTARAYQAKSGYVTIKPYATSVNVPVRVYSGTTTQDEAFNVNLKSATNASLATALPGGTFGRVVVLGSAAASTKPTITVADTAVVEGNYAAFTVTLSAASTEPVSFRYTTEDGTATSAQYTPVNNVLTIPAGQTTATIILPTTANTSFTGAQVFFLKLDAAANATLASNTAGAVILDTNPEPSFSVASVTDAITPGPTTTVDFTVSLSTAYILPTVVSYTTFDGTAIAGTNYTAAAGTLLFQPGVTTMTVPVTFTNPAPTATATASETFGLNLYGALNATISSGIASATITAGGGGLPTSPTNPTGTEPGIVVAGGSAVVGTSGTSTLPFTITLSAASTSTVTVDYTTVDGSAVAGTDYTATSGTATFAPGVLTQTIDVPVVGETTTATSKTLSLEISNATNAEITSNSITGVITYASGNPAISVSAPTATVSTTGTSTLTFTVALSAVSAEPVTVNYATADGTAIAGTDYTATSGTLTFAAGDTTMTVVVPLTDETSTVASKTLTLNLTGATETSNTTASGTGTISYIVPGTPSVTSGNLTNVTAGVETSTGTTYNAASFTTGSNSYTLNSVDLLLAESATGTATVEIETDDGGQPGTIVGTLTSPTTYSTTAADTVFTSTSGIALSASSTYWVVLIANTGSFDWSYTTDDTGTGVGFSDSWGQTSDSGTDWFTYDSSPVQMSVTATPNAS